MLVGRCYDLSETPPYGPWPRPSPARPRGDGLPACRRGLPPSATARRWPARRRSSRAVRDYLAALAARQPAGRCCWTTCTGPTPPPSTCCASSARGLADLPLLLLATYRADELTPPPPALRPPAAAGARGPRRAARPAPAGRGGHRARWSRRATPWPRPTRDAAGRLPGRRAPRATRSSRRAAARAGGARALLRRGGRRLGARRPGARCRVPALLRQVIDGRLARLGEEAQRLLAVAAVIGQEVPLALWAAVAEADEDDAARRRRAGDRRRGCWRRRRTGRRCASPTR